MSSVGGAEAAQGFVFRPRRWPTILTLLGLVVLVGLGTWQVQRLTWKTALIEERDQRLAAAPIPLPSQPDSTTDLRRVEVLGRFDHGREQVFGLFARAGEPGPHVLTPLLRDDGTAVLIDRGWIPEDARHPAARRQGQIEGEVEIRGIARHREDDRPGWMTPANRPNDGRWYWYDMEALREATGLELLPVVIEADATPNPGGLPQGGQSLTELRNPHLGYAITWYGLALTLLGVYLAFSLERTKR